MIKKDDFFKQTWVKITTYIIIAILAGLITFFGTSFTKKWDQVDDDHDALIEVTSLSDFNKEQIDKFAAQMGDLKGVIDELKWTMRELKIVVDRLRER